jgi:two-component system, NarL family, response regulator
MSQSIRIVIIDDHSVVRDGLVAVLRAEPDFHVVATYSNGAEALSAALSDKPDVALVDLRLPVMDGVSVLVALKTKLPKLRVLMLSSQDGDEAVARALRAGASGYILKRQPIRELVDAVRLSLSGKVPLSPDLSARLVNHLDGHALTSREIDILKQIANGLSNKRIGDELGISHNTVKNHIVSLMEKLSAQDRTQAVTIALQRGIIDFD